MEPIRATKIVSQRGPWWIEHPRRQRPRGRICRNRYCDTILSVYNRQEYCSICSRAYDPKEQKYDHA
jgi:hypothetical protein